MSFSVGALYSAQELLDLASAYNLQAGEFLVQSRFVLARSDVILGTVQDCGWVRLSTTGTIQLTPRGLAIRDCALAAAKLRMQIEDMIAIRRPPWANRIMHGRKEALTAMPDDALQCFKECGLLDAWTDELIGWWRSAASIVRARRSESLSRTGHEAERLSCKYEQDRTGNYPIWVALDSTFAGFDVLSRQSATDSEPLSIEVKGSERPQKQADFTVTRHEAETASNTANYVLHLWLVSSKPKLFVVPFEAVEPHLPNDRELGAWQQTRVPYSPFTAYQRV